MCRVVFVAHGLGLLVLAASLAHEIAGQPVANSEGVGRQGRALLQNVRPEKWISLSTIVSHKDGGEPITVKGEAFLQRFSYFCVFTWDSVGYPSCDSPMQTTATAASQPFSLNTSATIDASDPDSQTLTCSSIAFPMDPTYLTGKTDFSLVAVDTNGVESLILAAWTNMTKFYFFDDTHFGPSPLEDTVYVDGVDCAGFDITFNASQGLGPLRMHVEYTPLVPNRGESFTDFTTPSRDEILRKTSPLPSVLYSDASLLDLFLDDTDYCLGNTSFTLKLPYEGSAGPPRKMSKSGAELSILDNLQQPSRLTLDSISGCAEATTCGRVQWNVSQGWEGWAYQICFRAVPAGVPFWALDMGRSYVGSRCVFVVVPKCHKCVSPADSLFSIASGFATSWLDLWSVNPELINSTAASATDRVFNGPSDRAYPFVGAGASLRLGLQYKVRAQDSVYEVGRRFGVTLPNILALNPDVYSANQDQSMAGKTLCVLPSAAKYSECPVVSEDVDPLLFEEVLSYDERGVPIKLPNPQYPLPPGPRSESN